MTPARARARDAAERARRIARLDAALRIVRYPPTHATHANGGASGHYEIDYAAWATRLDAALRTIPE